MSGATLDRNRRAFNPRPAPRDALQRLEPCLWCAAMSSDDVAKSGNESRAQALYDRIAPLYAAVFKVIGYDRSVARFLRRRALPLAPHARVLDAGCGTGMMEAALLEASAQPLRVTAVDISGASVVRARRSIRHDFPAHAGSVAFAQANVLKLPFGDGTFDALVTCGVLEYVPIDEGLAEFARVLKPGGWMLHLPVRRSLVGRLLEKPYQFRILDHDRVLAETRRWFRDVRVEPLPSLEPIAWSKHAITGVRTP